MTIDEILENWQQDANIDKTELGEEALKIPKLHHKYYQFFVKEKMMLRKHESEMKQLRLDKYEFLTQGPNEETKDKGWKLPPKGMILKGDIPMYLEGDQDIINLSLKIGYQQEKVELLESIIKSIMNRNFVIRAGIDWQKFTMGA